MAFCNFPASPPGLAQVLPTLRIGHAERIYDAFLLYANDISEQPQLISKSWTDRMVIKIKLISYIVN